MQHAADWGNRATSKASRASRRARKELGVRRSRVIANEKDSLISRKHLDLLQDSLEIIARWHMMDASLPLLGAGRTSTEGLQEARDKVASY